MKAVIFDMDGVLFDTERVCMEVWVAVAEKLGLAGMEEVFPAVIGLNVNDSRQIMKKAYGADFDYPYFRKLAAEGFQAYIEEKGLPVKPGVREILRWLKESGYAVGLASSTGEKDVRSHLRRVGLSDYFPVVVTGDMVEHSKPLPDIYLLACEKLGVEPARAYAIEDSPNGIRSAHAAGMRPVMVPDMIAPDEEMRRLSCVILEDLTQALAFLQEEREKEDQEKRDGESGNPA